MGTCISRCSCRPSRVQEPAEPIQDKLVIVSQSPSSPLPKKCFASSPIKPPPSPSLSSAPSSTTTSTNTTSCSSDFSSFASSCVSSKERSFSNEFLWTCIKEHPQIIQLSPAKPPRPKSPGPATQPQPQRHQRRPSPPSPARGPQAPRRTGTGSPRRVVPTNSSSSSSLAPQRSFRKERNGPNAASRRLEGDAHSVSANVGSRRGRSTGNSNSTKENRRPSSGGDGGRSPWRAGKRKEAACFHSGQKQGDKKMAQMMTSVHQIDAIVPMDNQTVEWDEALLCETDLRQECSSTPREDIDNPLIALDCFIFL